jgi:D-tyrosyl-tRNA(Tyr) deacylase
MRAVVQRVSEARVHVGDRITGEIGPGLLVFVGIGKDDGVDDVEYLANKIVTLRVFRGDDPSTGSGSPRAQSRGEGKDIDRSVADIGGSILVVSQFTLFGDARGQRRPSFIAAAPPEQARALYDDLVRELRAAAVPVATGEFQAMRRVELVNDGPVTLLLDSKKSF